MASNTHPNPVEAPPVTSFEAFAKAVQFRFAQMSEGELFVVGEADGMFDKYLESFPAGTDPFFRKRTEHDCSTCRNFVKNLGRVVSITQDGFINTVWDDGHLLGSPYKEVADAMAAYVRSLPITSVFRTKERQYGALSTIEYSDGDTRRWNHFFGSVAGRHFTTTPEAARGDYNTGAQMLRRALNEVKPDALQQVIDLIESDGLYRGAEKLTVLRDFRAVQNEYHALPDPSDFGAESRFVWARAGNPAIARFRGDVIYTLVQELSEGIDADRAVRAYETKVAPTNYRRTTAVITPSMVKSAMKTIEELGLESALNRRLASVSDVALNDVLWADRATQGAMKGGIESILMGEAVSRAPSSENAADVGIDYFLAEVLPGAQGVELHLKNEHLGKFMTVTAPVEPDTGKLLRWGNDFSWAYDGNIADSEIRRAVSGRGGRVDGAFRFSHSWNYGKRNASLMDLHVFLPGSNIKPGDGVNDTYGNDQRVGWNHRNHSGTSGVQDVDYVQAAPVGYVPVENITFPDLKRMPEGKYQCKIHNWNKRSPTEGGFRAELEFGGELFEYEVDRPLGHKEWVSVATATLKDGKFSVEHHLPCRSSQQQKWGVKTQTAVKVRTVMLSPNHWGAEAVGPKHVFFILDGCRTEEPMRGFFVENLAPELNAHRKVFETLTDKTKCPPTSDQLSGVGFTAARGDSVLLSVKTGKGTRLYNVTF